MAQQHDAAYATLVMTDSYLPGAMVLGHSLKDRGAKARLAALVLIEKLSMETITELQTIYDDIIPVEQIVNMQPANLYLMNRPDLISTFTKIELWKQTQFKRLVYLDADMVVLRAPNELLRMETNFAAVPDVGWPDCFNSGMMVLNPNMGDYYSLQALARRGISFDGADQGLLNMHFTEWERLSFTYNCTPNANYQYVPAYKHFQSGINAIHFIGVEKPWSLGRNHQTNSGVYGELLARWWAVYDRHYRRPVTSSLHMESRKKVQDYVRGEETRYEPAPQITISQNQRHDQNQYQNAQQNQDRGPPPSENRRNSTGYGIRQPQPARVPGIHAFASEGNPAAMERPFMDQPSVEEKIEHNEYTPTTTQEQRRWSAPHAEWEPARQPPPINSKPEAANFPTQQYEMSESTKFFEAPVQYPEPPKDMWYEVPKEKPTPTAPPKHIFPWEERAPKPTRVFPKSREPTPPPVEDPEPPATTASGSRPQSAALQSATTFGAIDDSNEQSSTKTSELSRAVTEAFSKSQHSPKPPSPPRHVFPWESRAPKPTRVFHSDSIYSPVPDSMPHKNESTTAPDTQESTDGSAIPRPLDNPWDAFAQQTNKWDEDPDISKFMENFNKPRRAPIQVVHDSRTSTDGQLPITERRTSLKLTDFPTEVERPSLPVTPAPIRRPTFWGADEQDDSNKALFPVARGVPRQDEWVRRFTSQYLPHLPDPVLRDINGILHLSCQHCGRQNPVIRLDELQRRQSLLMAAEGEVLQKPKTPPRRQMPESQSADEAVAAAMKAMLAAHEKPRAPVKPILKEPHFEITEAKDDELGNESIVATAHMTATGSKSPTRFNPIILEGIAASERNDFFNTETTKEELSEHTSATHHSTSSTSASTSFHEAATVTTPEMESAGFDYSTNSLSPTQSRTDLKDAARGKVVEEELISPSTVA